MTDKTFVTLCDGNGRTGRLILNLELMKQGYPPINIKYSDRKSYYESFTGYHTKNDPIAIVIKKHQNKMIKKSKKTLNITERK